MIHRPMTPSYVPDVTHIEDDKGPIPHIEPFVVTESASEKPRKKRPKKKVIVDVVVDPNPVDWGSW